MSDVLLITSNGVGMGHLTRQAAIARSLPSEHNPTIMSLSRGLPLISPLGIAGEYCPGYDMPWIAATQWHGYLRDRILALVEELGAKVVVFDGVAPYPGVGMASARAPHVAFVWLRRGFWRPGANTEALKKGIYFDLIVEPGDLAAAGDRGATAGRDDCSTVGPVSLLEGLEPLSREAAREALALPPDEVVALVTLGSGMLGDSAGPARISIDAVLESTDWHVAVTKAPLAKEALEHDGVGRVHEISGVYPLANYLAAFDVAVTSAGYNAVHELIPAGIPTLVVANTSTRTDDQTARAQQLAATGLALWARDDEGDGVAAAVRQLTSSDVRLDLAASSDATRPTLTGASETAEIVVDLLASHRPRPAGGARSVSLAWQGFKNRTKEIIGQDATNRVRSLLGRDPIAFGERTTVSVVEDAVDAAFDGAVPLLFGQVAPNEVVSDRMPVEHVRNGSSGAYRKRRRAIIDRYYDVVP